ncbi:MAG: Ig domain-containing protein [Ruminococcaceae bacterium]|nr:Ig domain-containing protein [Oscillospiraceae bacterium]
MRARLPFEVDFLQSPAATLTLLAPEAALPADPASPTDTAPQSVAVKSVEMPMGAKMLEKGRKVTLKATVSPANAANKKITWRSSDKKVATVSSKGVVKALKNGKATITATAGGKTAKCTITVSANAAQKAVRAVTLSKRKATLKTSKTLRLMATVAPQAAKQKKVVWASSDPKIATVSASGVVKALTRGTVKITASSYEGGKKAVCTVTVR